VTASNPSFPGGIEAFEKFNCDALHGLTDLFDANFAAFVNRQKGPSDYPPFIAYTDQVISHVRVFEHAANELNAIGRAKLHDLVQFTITSLNEVKNKLVDMHAHAAEIAAQNTKQIDAKIRQALADAAAYEIKIRNEIFENQKAVFESTQAAWRSYREEARKHPIPIRDHTIKIR
jgi:hypothetical protein